MRRIGSFLLGLVVACGFVVAPGSAPAEALSAGVQFTADDLPTWQTNGTVWALAHSGGTVFAGGTFSEIRPPDGGAGSPQAQASFVSFDAASGQPGACRPGVTGSGGTVRALATTADGSTLFIGGDFAFVGGVNRARLAALDVASCTVKAFNTPLINGLVRGLAVAGNTLYVAGEFQSVGAATRQSFAAFDATTGALLAWTANADAFGKAVAVSPDGTLVAIGGDFFTVNGQASHSIAIVDPVTGANIRSYPAPFVPNTSTTQAITTDATGFYVANEGTGGGVFDGTFAIDYATLDQRWRDTCLGATQALAIEGGTIYEAHHHHDCLSMGWFPDGMRTYLSANRTSDAQLLAWYPRLNDGLEEGIGGRALTIAPSGAQKYLWVGGMFTQTNGKAQQGLTRFGQTPDTGNPPVPTDVSTESLVTGQVKVRWRTVLDPDDGLLTYRVYRNGTKIGQVQAESRWWYRPQASFTDTTAVPGVTYSYQVDSTDGINTLALSAPVNGTAVGASAPYASKVIADGATSYWRFDAASGEYGADSSLGDDNPRYARSPLYRASGNAISAEPGYAMGFNGSAYAWSDNYGWGPSVYSVELWFNTTTTVGGKLIGYGNQIPTNHVPPRYNLSSVYDRHVYMRNDGRLVFGAYAGSTQTISSSAAYRDGKWHHVVATQGSAGMRLYVDGAQVASNSVTGNQSYRGSWRVGGDSLNGWPNQPSSHYFNGLIDEAAVYPTALSAAQVLAHYQAGTGAATPDTTAPTAPAGLAATASGADVTLTWTASSDATGVAGYEIHRSTTEGFTPSPATALTFTNATTYTDPGLTSGTRYYRVIATDAAGNKSTPSNQANATVVVAETIPLAPTGDAYVHSGTPLTNYNTVNQLWSLAPSPELNSYLAFTLPDAPYGTTLVGARLRVRTTTSTAAGSTGAFDVSLATGTWAESTLNYTNRPSRGSALGQLPGGTRPDAQYEIALNRATLATQLGSPTTLVITGVPGVSDTLGLWSKEFSVASYRPALILDFVPTDSLDTTAPSTPSNLTATPTGPDVNLSWTASSDNVAVTGYQVHRSTTDGFTPSPSTQIATPTGTTYTDPNPGLGTWYYRVTATDAAGNTATPSAQATATVTPGGTMVIQTIAPTDDAYVRSDTPNSNYNSVNQLSSRAPTPELASYLAFSLPAAPPGTTLAGASLRVRTTTASTSGSTGAFNVSLATGTWTEAAVTFLTRPSVTTVLGQLPGGTVPNAQYEITLNPAALTDMLGKPATLAVTGSPGATDSLALWSKEFSVASYRPALVLSFVAAP